MTPDRRSASYSEQASDDRETHVRLLAMCGIIGYVGGQPALGVSRRSATTRVPRVRLGGGRGRVAGRRPRTRRAASWPTWRRRSPRPTNLDRLGTTGMGHTRWATHGGPTDATRTRTPTARVPSPSSTTGSSRTSPRCAPSWSGPGTSWPARPTPRWWRTCSRPSTRARRRGRDGASGGELVGALRRVCRRLEGAFTLVVVHRDHPGLVVAARRNSPLVAGLGDGETFSPATSPRSSRTPAPPSRSGRTE